MRPASVSSSFWLMQTASIQSNVKDWSHHSCEEQVLDSPRLGQARHSTRFALTIVAPLHSYDRAQYSGRHADGNFQGSRDSLMRKESYQANLRFEALSGKYSQKREICNCYGRGIFDRQLLSAGVSFTTPLTKGILRVETTRSMPGMVQGVQTVVAVAHVWYLRAGRILEGYKAISPFVGEAVWGLKLGLGPDPRSG
jgi:hypothetical protein